MHFFLACFQGECWCSGGACCSVAYALGKLVISVLSFAVLSIMCSRFGCVEPLPIFLGTEPFPSRFGICDVSPSSDFDI